MVMSKDPFENYSSKKRKLKNGAISGLALFALLGSFGYYMIQNHEKPIQIPHSFKDFTFPQDKFIDENTISSINENRRKIEELKKLLFLQKHAPEAEIVEEFTSKLEQKNAEADFLIKALKEEQKRAENLSLAILNFQEKFGSELAEKEQEKDLIVLNLQNVLFEQQERMKQIEKEKFDLQEFLSLKSDAEERTGSAWKEYAIDLTKEIEALQDHLLAIEQAKAEKDEEIAILSKKISDLELAFDNRKQSLENFKKYLVKLGHIHVALGDSLLIERLLQKIYQQEEKNLFAKEQKLLMDKLSDLHEEIDNIYAKLYDEELDKESALAELDFAKEKNVLLANKLKDSQKEAEEALYLAGLKNSTLEEALLVQELKFALINEQFSNEKSSLLEEKAAFKNETESTAAELLALKESLENKQNLLENAQRELAEVFEKREYLAEENERYKSILENRDHDLNVSSNSEKLLKDELELARTEQLNMEKLLKQKEEFLAEALDKENQLIAALNDSERELDQFCTLFEKTLQFTRTETEELRRANEELYAKLAEKEKSLLVENKHKTELDEAFKEKSQELQGLKMERDSLAKLLEERETELQTFSKNEYLLQKDLTDALAAIDDLEYVKSENERLLALLNETGDSLATRKEVERHLKEEISSLLSLKEELEVAKIRKEEEERALIAELDGRLLQSDEAKVRELTLQNAIEAYKTHLAELEKKNQELGEELSLVKNARGTIESEHLLALAQTEKLLEELQLYKNEKFELEKENSLAKTNLEELRAKEGAARHYAESLESMVAEKEKAFGKLQLEDSSLKENLLRETENLKLALEEEKSVHQQIELALQRKEKEHLDALQALDSLKRDLLEKETLLSLTMGEQVQLKKDIDQNIDRLQGLLKLQTIKAETLQKAFDQEKNKSEANNLEIARLDAKLEENYKSLLLLEQREKANEERFVAEKAALAELLEKENSKVKNLSDELIQAKAHQAETESSVFELKRMLQEKEIALLDEIDSHHTVQEHLNRKIAELTDLLRQQSLNEEQGAG